MKTSRRTFLRNTIALGVGTIVLPSTVIAAKTTVMASEPNDAFQAKTVGEALEKLFPGAKIEESDKITIKAPKIAENGLVVPIEIRADIDGVESIAVLSENNPMPLVSQFQFAGKGKGWLKIRIKMGRTGNVIVVVKADGKLYRASQEVKVTIGGCGG